MKRLLLVLASIALTPLVALAAVQRPAGRFLYQPMFIWGTGEVTHQGTGYLVEHGKQVFGVTSVHFMNFEAGGLFEAIWTDISTATPVAGFRKSLGRPERMAIDRYIDIQHDFIVLPAEQLPERHSTLQLDTTASYPPKTKLWFPNKSADQKDGYEWIEAEVVKDEGHMIRVRLLRDIKLQSQSGSPFLREDTGAVVGMLMGGDEKEIILCPARGIAKHIERKPREFPLMESVKKG